MRSKKNDIMILSMTGYGKGAEIFDGKEITVEIKSLNGKTSDVRLRVPNAYKQKEMELRKLVINHALRGKIDFSIKIGAGFDDDEFVINTPLIKKCAAELKTIQNELELSNTDILQSIMRIPNAVISNELEVTDEEWEAIKKATLLALDQLKDFRKEEGNSLKEDFVLRVTNINNLLDAVEPHEKERVEKLKERLTKNLNQYVKDENVDQNRFEQEIIYYLEKIDITEEKVRLKQHCIYFIDTLNNSDEEVGKKLGFISQEIGREINTLGAKAQNSDIQKIVVNMKDELEKIKEQLANII